VVSWHRQRGLELRRDPPLPYRVIVPDRTPGDASSKARLERGTARRVISPETDRDDADLFAVNILAPLQEIDAGAARFFIIVAQDEAAETNRFAGSRPVHHQD